MIHDNSLSPKSDFLKNTKAAGDFMDIVMNPSFRACVDVALTEYVMRLNAKDPRSAFRIGGARDVLNILMNLGNKSHLMTEEDEPQHLTPV